MADPSLMQLIEQEEAEGAWRRQYVLSEEDKTQFTTEATVGFYRWFRSPNVVCIETARRLRDRG